MNWTTEIPTEPGWYWAMFIAKPQIVEVGKNSKGRLRFWETGISGEGSEGVLEWVDAWIGPLPVPELPE